MNAKTAVNKGDRCAISVSEIDGNHGFYDWSNFYYADVSPYPPCDYTEQ